MVILLQQFLSALVLFVILNHGCLAENFTSETATTKYGNKLRRSKSNSTVHNKCANLHREHGVVPGQSWGTMSLEQQNIWMTLHCDNLYCEPNPLEGKGTHYFLINRMLTEQWLNSCRYL